MGVSSERHSPAALYPWEWFPGTHWLGDLSGPHSWFGQRLDEKSVVSVHAENRTPVAQPVVRHTD
jgi:hypothetical protein